MAATYKYSDIITVIGKTIPKTVEDHFSPLICNIGTNLIYFAYDWRETLETLPPFYLVPGEQDHAIPAVIVPSDFHGLRKAHLARFSGRSATRDDLFVLKDLSLTNIRSLPKSISYEASINGFRLHPRVPINVGTPEYFVEGTYKKRPAKITNTTLDTTLPFDDMYFHVFVETFRWAAFMLAGDSRAGQVQMNGPQVVYTGQLAAAMSAIEAMGRAEGMNDGDLNIHPHESLVSSGLGNLYTASGLVGLR